MSGDAKTRIEINGREYASVDDMPPDVRKLYEEALRQLRDQGPGGPAAGTEDAGSPETHTTIRTTRRLIVNGEEISSLDELPEDMRAMVRRALASAGDVETVVVSSELGEADPKRAVDRPRVVGDEPTVVGSKPAREQPIWADWMGKATERRRVRVRVSPARLLFWIGLIILIIYLYLRRH